LAAETTQVVSRSTMVIWNFCMKNLVVVVVKKKEEEEEENQL
jgi:hypothetical protein